MTNKEAAEYFASLDPEKEASIYFANGDLGTIEDEPLIAQKDLDIDLNECDGVENLDVRKPVIYQKW